MPSLELKSHFSLVTEFPDCTFLAKKWRNLAFFVKTLAIFRSKNLVTLFTGLICISDLRGIEAWSFDLNEAEEKYLVQSGKDELKAIGTRWRNRLPSLLQGKYNPNATTVSCQPS